MANLASFESEESRPVTHRQVTVTEKMEEKKSALEREMAATNEALDALKANPEIERVLNLVQKASRGY